MPIVVWGKQAESSATYVSKGKLIGVSGRIQIRNYDAKDGTKRYVTEVVADEVQFLEWANNGQAAAPQKSNSNPKGYEEIIPIDEEGEIPF